MPDFPVQLDKNFNMEIYNITITTIDQVEENDLLKNYKSMIKLKEMVHIGIGCLRNREKIDATIAPIVCFFCWDRAGEHK